MADNYANTEKLLDDVLKGRITKQEAEAQLQQETGDAAKAIEMHQLAASAIQRYSVLQQVALIHQSFVQNRVSQEQAGGMASQKSKVIRIKPLKMLIRVAAVLLITAGGLFAWQYSSNNSTKLYSELYEPYTVIVDRGAGVDTNLQLVQQYQQHKYGDVIRSYAALSGRNSRARFLTAMSYSEQGDYTKAATLLEELLEENRKAGSTLYNDAAEFYLGTAYLKTKKYKQAYTYLNRVYNDVRHTYHEKVDRWLLVRLKWLK